MTIEVERMLDAPGDEAACVGKAGEVQHRLKSMIGLTCDVPSRRPARCRARRARRCG
jgi:hypothetical protein